MKMREDSRILDKQRWAMEATSWAEVGPGRSVQAGRPSPPQGPAEYEALLHGLRLAASLGIKRLLVYDDFAVVMNQVNKSWDRNKENMDAYCLEVRKL
jgi:hypothetical protein